MLKLNEYQYTKTRDYVFPITVMGDVVQCFTANGESVYKNINDFEEDVKKPKQSKKVVEVSPIQSKNTDELYNEEEDLPDDGLREEESTEDTSVEDTSTDTEDTTEDTTEEEEEGTITQTENIYDDDNYI